MADQKDKAQEKRKLEETEPEQHEHGHGGSGGNMGAGKSGKVHQDSEKPDDDAGPHKQKSGGPSSQQ